MLTVVTMPITENKTIATTTTTSAIDTTGLLTLTVNIMIFSSDKLSTFGGKGY